MPAHAAGQQRADVLNRREAWFEAQPDLNPEKLIFIDETAASTKMARHRSAWALEDHHFHRRSAAVRQVTANAEQLLAPELRPGDIVVMDTLPFHKVAGVGDTVEKYGARLLFLPPYSCDFNPIESVFSRRC